jgi:uncharacterized protein (DUF433 family)
MSIDARSAAIERVPGVMGGKPVIKGTRIRVSDLVWYRKRWREDAKRHVLLGFPQLTDEQVEAAFRYYDEHTAEIDDEIRTDRRTAEEWQSHPRST